MSEARKPYFLPLNKEFYLKVKSGEQNCEIRPANHRGWNSKNIYPGRWLKFSSGYGDHDRHCREICATREGSASFAFAGVRMPYLYRQHWLKRLCAKAGVKQFGFHGIRHLFASILASKNVPLVEIQKMLRHGSIQTTARLSTRCRRGAGRRWRLCQG